MQLVLLGDLGQSRCVKWNRVSSEIRSLQPLMFVSTDRDQKYLRGNGVVFSACQVLTKFRIIAVTINRIWMSRTSESSYFV